MVNPSLNFFNKTVFNEHLKIRSHDTGNSSLEKEWLSSLLQQSLGIMLRQYTLYFEGKQNDDVMSKTFQERLFARNYFTIRINILKY